MNGLLVAEAVLFFIELSGKVVVKLPAKYERESNFARHNLVGYHGSQPIDICSFNVDEQAVVSQRQTTHQMSFEARYFFLSYKSAFHFPAGFGQAERCSDRTGN
ncbi:hypothetical protein GCM10027056_30660 [Glaciibacter psychrotolerans]